MSLTQVNSAGILNDAVTGAKIADDAIGAEHIELLDAPLHIADATNLVIGTGSDLKLWHYSDHSYIRNETGNLTIEANGAGDDAIKIVPDGTVELYYDNSKKIATKSNGAFVHGDANGAYLILADTSSNYCYQLIGQDAVAAGAGGRLIFADADGGTVLDLQQAGTNIFCKNNLRLDVDNLKLELGASQDLQIYHNGTENIIFSDVPNLYIRTTSDETCARFGRNGGVDLYFDNVKSLTTNANGATVYGGEGQHANLYLYADEGDDNADKLRIQQSSTGDLWIENYASGSWEAHLKASNNGAVELYYDNSKKLHTVSGGIYVTGNVYANNTGTTAAFSCTDNGRSAWGSNNDLQIYHDGNHNLILGSPTVLIKNQANSESYIRCNENAEVSLYYDNSKKLETDANGVTITGQCAVTSHVAIPDANGSGSGYIGKVVLGAGDDFQLFHNGTNNYIYATSPLWVQNNSIELQTQGGEKYATCTANGAVDLYYDNSKKFETMSYGGRLHGTHWYVNGGATFAPNTDGSSVLGTSTYKWSEVYATNGTIQTSDRNEKNTIVQSDLGLSFINQLKPVSYKFNGKDKTHYGLIAQDLEEVLEKEGKSLDDFAGIVKDEKYGLNYSELISPLIKSIQELSAKIAALEA